MPVDRSTLPPLPGKPDWYVENAPQAIDLKAEERSEDARRPFSIPSPAMGGPLDAEAFRASLGVTDPPSYTAAPQFPTAPTEPAEHHGRRFGKVKALAGRIKH
ncbi:MAG TPA: hypothetical protein VFK41_11845 [Nocardioidaceae bacterium]|nr:hypothetical protein [Nocardioidaceae bacterium]